MKQDINSRIETLISEGWDIDMITDIVVEEYHMPEVPARNYILLCAGYGY